jgi:hypothetical protein
MCGVCVYAYMLHANGPSLSLVIQFKGSGGNATSSCLLQHFLVRKTPSLSMYSGLTNMCRSTRKESLFSFPAAFFFLSLMLRYRTHQFWFKHNTDHVAVLNQCIRSIIYRYHWKEVMAVFVELRKHHRTFSDLIFNTLR